MRIAVNFHVASHIASTVLAFIASIPTGAQESGLKLSTPEQIKEDFKTIPCEDKKRLEAVTALFERAGAASSEITIDKYKDVENFVLLKKGESSEKIGSRAMAKAIGKEQAAEYCAMINIDSLGLSSPQVADNMSGKKLGQFTEDVAKEMKMPFAHASIEGADSDSSPFIEKKIPPVTIHGMSNEWSKILHSSNDQVSKVNPVSVYLGYRLILAMIMNLDQSACAAYK